VGVVEYCLVHTPAISTSSAFPSSNADDATVELKEHILAAVKWYQDHPQKFVLGNVIVISTFVSDHMTCASFMPVSRILSRAIAIDTIIKLDYGEDRVCIAIPVRRHYLYSIQMFIMVCVYISMIKHCYSCCLLHVIKSNISVILYTIPWLKYNYVIVNL